MLRSRKFSMFVSVGSSPEEYVDYYELSGERVVESDPSSATATTSTARQGTLA